MFVIVLILLAALLYYFGINRILGKQSFVATSMIEKYPNYLRRTYKQNHSRLACWASSSSSDRQYAIIPMGPGQSKEKDQATHYANIHCRFSSNGKLATVAYSPFGYRIRWLWLAITKWAFSNLFLIEKVLQILQEHVVRDGNNFIGELIVYLCVVFPPWNVYFKKWNIFQTGRFRSRCLISGSADRTGSAFRRTQSWKYAQNNSIKLNISFRKPGSLHSRHSTRSVSTRRLLRFVFVSSRKRFIIEDIVHNYALEIISRWRNSEGAALNVSENFEVTILKIWRDWWSFFSNKIALTLRKPSAMLSGESHSASTSTSTTTLCRNTGK